ARRARGRPRDLPAHAGERTLAERRDRRVRRGDGGRAPVRGAGGALAGRVRPLSAPVVTDQPAPSPRRGRSASPSRRKPFFRRICPASTLSSTQIAMVGLPVVRSSTG